LQVVPIPEPKDSEVLIRVEAAPINPSDLGLLVAGADISTATFSDQRDSPVVRASVPAATMRAVGGRAGKSLPVGNEGAGT
jgi:NADPH:quinone reductase-like Zn-dependent oxidoreductase